MDQMFDRYALFVSAEFFVEYWPTLTGTGLSPDAVGIVQSAGRATVRNFMAGESIYWNSDFSPERFVRSEALFLDGLRSLTDGQRLAEEAMRRNYCDDKNEQDNVAFALGFLARLSGDREFCVDVGVSLSDADIVSTCLASPEDMEVDTFRVKRDWLASKAKWDVAIRELTPDVPEYVALHFENAIDKHVALPMFVANLEKVLEPGLRRSLLARLVKVIETQMPRGSHRSVPFALRAAL